MESVHVLLVMKHIQVDKHLCSLNKALALRQTEMPTSSPHLVSDDTMLVSGDRSVSFPGDRLILMIVFKECLNDILAHYLQ